MSCGGGTDGVEDRWNEKDLGGPGDVNRCQLASGLTAVKLATCTIHVEIQMSVKRT